MTAPKKSPVKKPTKADLLRAKRAKRKPMSGRQLKMQATPPSGFSGRWFNDEGSRLQQAIDAGWLFTDKSTKGVLASSDDPGTRVRILVNRKRSEPVYAYFMVIEQELYQEDQAAKAASVKETVKQIERKPPTQAGSEDDQVYVKTADLSRSPL